MKTLLFASLLIGLSASAQIVDTNFPAATNWAVWFGPWPANYPTSAPTWSVFLGTNTDVTPPAILMTDFALQDCIATNAPVIWQMQSNGNFIARAAASSNYNLWYGMFTNIPAGIVDSSNRITTLAGLSASFGSGTNTAAGTNTIIKQVIQNAQVSYIYLNQIIAYLSRLGPGLQQIYKPAIDPVGH